VSDAARSPSEQRLAGLLLGTALGDALGLPAEGMSAAAIRRRFGRVDRFRLLGHTGFVSDDTEQAALVAESLAREPDDPEACAAAFRGALVRWFFRLPFGAGLATIRASLRAAAGLHPSGVVSAGNGAMMRAPVVGAALPDAARRRAFGVALAEVTHRDPRAVEAALYAAEVAAACAAGEPEADRAALCRAAAAGVAAPALREALDRAFAAAESGETLEAAAPRLGTSGYAPHTAALTTLAFIRHGDDPLGGFVAIIAAGGDADSNAAILGAWLGALHGEAGLPPALLARLHDGPFGPRHLRGLAAALARGGRPPSYSGAAALARNLALYPVILAHGFRRLLP
jgi:ADP-ribosyl-[dinitrogen reductase] hydrolase